MFHDFSELTRLASVYRTSCLDDNMKNEIIRYQISQSLLLHQYICTFKHVFILTYVRRPGKYIILKYTSINRGQ